MLVMALSISHFFRLKTWVSCFCNSFSIFVSVSELFLVSHKSLDFYHDQGKLTLGQSVKFFYLCYFIYIILSILFYLSILFTIAEKWLSKSTKISIRSSFNIKLWEPEILSKLGLELLCTSIVYILTLCRIHIFRFHWIITFELKT